MDIPLDREALKALASETRASILRLLEQRRHTQTELAQALGIAVPTAKEHVEALTRAGLVEVHEEGRKWKYCSLTRKARDLLNPEQKRIVLLLVLAILSAAGAFLTLAGSLLGGLGIAKMAAAPAQEAAFGAARAPAATPLALTPGTAWLTILLTLTAAFGILAFHSWMRNRDARRKLLHRKAEP
jgi:DNA-binding transcriptional ArsR family regulator